MSQPRRVSIWDLGIIGRSNVEALQQAISNGASIHERSENDYSLLHCAAENNAKDNVVFLLEQGINPVQRSLGKTASRMARDQGNQEVADLIDSFVETHWKDRTPICPDCGDRMEQGLIPDLSYESRYHSDTCRTFWIEGTPVGPKGNRLASDANGLNDLNAIPVVAFRCKECGLLRQYASGK